MPAGAAIKPVDTQSPLQQYMSNYGERLQSLLAGDPAAGQDVPPGQNLGPDMYQPNPQPFGPNAGQPPPDPGQPAPDQSAQQGKPAPQSALGAAAGEQPSGDKGGASFRDLWQKQSAAQRKEYIDKLQTHLDTTNQTINSAYDKMMQQLGGRPSTDISKQDKGMLLMEFGLHMMANSRGQQQGGGGGLGTNLGANIGQSGLETLQSAKGLKAQKIAGQQNYDKRAQDLAIAHSRDVTSLASRSALEEGRDLRAAGAQDASIARVTAQQAGADTRNTDRIEAAGKRTEITEAGKNKRAGMQFGQVTRTVTAEDGSTYGLTKGGQMVPLKDAKGAQIKAMPGGAGGAKQTAAQANYQLYMDTFGKDSEGNDLEGDELQDARQKALEYAANPKAAAPLTDSQMREMAEKSANTQIRANPLAWAGSTDKEIQARQAEISEQVYQRLKRNGSNPSPIAGAGMTPKGRSPASALGAAAAAKGTSKAGGAIPTQPPAGGPGPNSAQLKALQTNPGKIAPYFLKKFGYLPKEFHQYAKPAAPTSALSQ